MLDISPVLIISSGIIFLLVLARLNTCLFKPLLKHMDDRSLSIKTDLENAKSNTADVNGMLSEANDVIVKAKKEASAIREKAQNEAFEEANSKLDTAKLDIENKYSNFTEELSSEVADLKKSLFASLPQFTESLKAKLNSI